MASVFMTFTGVYNAILGILVLLGLFIYFQKKIIFLWLCVWAFALALVLYHQVHLTTQVDSFYGEEVKIKGIVSRFPEYRQGEMHLYIKASEVCQGEICKNINEGVLVKAPVQKSIHYGDRGLFFGSLSAPQSFSGFDYKSFLKRLKVFSILRSKDIEILESDQGNSLFQKAYRLRLGFQKNISAYVPYPYNTLAEGVLLGVKETFPPWVAHLFRQAGLQHIIVVSGFNISVIVLLLLFLTRSLGPFLSFFLITLAIIGFIALTGADPPVIRAGIMGIIGVYALWRGKSTEGLHALLIAGVLVGIWNPYLLRYDLGFQLSFIATLSIILGGAYAQKKLSFIPSPLREIIAISTVAQLGVFPFLGAFFAEVQIGGFLANIIIDPFVPLLMLFGFITGVLGGIFESLGSFFGIITQLISICIFWMARLFSAFPSFEVDTLLFKTFLGGEIFLFIYLVMKDLDSREGCNILEKKENLEE